MKETAIVRVVDEFHLRTGKDRIVHAGLPSPVSCDRSGEDSGHPRIRLQSSFEQESPEYFDRWGLFASRDGNF
jgi:hypothetical protein